MGEFSAIFLWNTTLPEMFWYKVPSNPDTGNTESKHCSVLFWRSAHIKSRKGCNVDALYNVLNQILETITVPLSNAGQNKV